MSQAAADHFRPYSFQMVLALFSCTKWEGEPFAREGQPLVKWVTAEELGTLPMLRLDVPMLPEVQAAMRRTNGGNE